jgi:FkbM family methyltransferase
MINYCNNIINKTNISPEIILEIGSRDGKDANILKDFFKLDDGNVYVVEPNPRQVDVIKNSYPNFNIIDKAIFNEEGFHDFFAVERDGLKGTSSLLNRRDNLYLRVGAKLIKVNTISGKRLLKIIGKDIDVCKIDVEGATYEVLESFGSDISKIKSFHIECEHKEVWNDQRLYEDIKDFLINMNFTQIYFKYVNNVVLQSDSIWINNRYLI